MFFNQFKTRSNEEEIMDDLDMTGEELEEALVALDRINWWLGGNQVLLSGLKKILKANPTFQNQTLRIADVGCGGGDGLRSIANWAKRQGIEVELIGIDANEFTLDYARQRSQQFKNITYLQADILDKNFSYQNFDIVLCGLFLHHFTDDQQEMWVKKCWKDGVKVLLINDLHRHWLAYVLFQLICFVFRASHMVQNDGSLSIKKGFIQSEFKQLQQRTNTTKATIQWKWAFRWQVIFYGER